MRTARRVGRAARLGDLVADDVDLFGRPLNIDGGVLRAAVVGELVLDDAIAMSGEILAAFGAEENARNLARRR